MREGGADSLPGRRAGPGEVHQGIDDGGTCEAAGSIEDGSMKRGAVSLRYSHSHTCVHLRLCCSLILWLNYY